MMRQHTFIISMSIMSTAIAGMIAMPDDTLTKTDYLKMINVTEFDCLKTCASRGNAERPAANDEPLDLRPTVKCDARDVYQNAPGCKSLATGLVQLHENKYAIVADKKVNWLQAPQICRKLNMQLITVDSEALNTKLANHLISKNLASTPFWSGAFVLGRGEQVIWLENGESVSPSIYGANKTAPNIAYSFTVNTTTKKLKWKDDSIGTFISVICETPDECFAQKCIAQ